MGKRILVIEDDLELQEVIRLSLEIMADFEVLLASSGQDGLKLAHAAHPDAILIDVLLPDIDGIDVCQQLRFQPETQTIPILLMTGNRLRLDIKRIEELGLEHVLSKPFQPTRLAQHISTCLNWATEVEYE